jgi:mannose/fructose-specific phosphotransferase system component IIA
MRRVAFASHSNLCIGLKDSVDLISGNTVTIETIAAFTDDTSLETKVAAFFSTIAEGDEVLVFTDLLGGSVNRAFLPYAQRPGVFVVAGMFLGLVLEVILLPEPLSTASIDAAIERATAGVIGMWNVHPTASDDDE